MAKSKPKTKTKKKGKKAWVERSEMVRGFYFELTDKELAVVADDIVDLLGRKNKLEAEFAEVRRECSGKIKDVAGEIEKLRQKHDAGKEWREVSCIQVKDFDEKEIRWEVDGEVMLSEPMALPEQPSLDEAAAYNAFADGQGEAERDDMEDDELPV